MKTFDEYKRDTRDLREQLRDILATLDNLSSHAQTLADCLSDLHTEVDDADTSALELYNHVGVVKPSQQHRIGEKHFRMLAVLNHYGPVPRAHVAKILGLKETSVDQLACQIRKHHLGDLKSRKGVYTLHALGDGVADSQDFKLL